MMNKLKVFISDDSATIRERLVTMALDLPQVDVVGQAEDVPRSLSAIRQTRPDVVILDIRMPGGNGIQVLREVKKMTPAPQVIMLTNFAYAQYRSKCEEAGADFFFDKSTEFEKLPQALEQVRQSLRPDPAETPDSPLQASDPPIPAEGGLMSKSGQNAGARRCPEHPRELMWEAYSKATGESRDVRGPIRRHREAGARAGQRAVRQTGRRRPAKSEWWGGRLEASPRASNAMVSPVSKPNQSSIVAPAERGQGGLELEHAFYSLSNMQRRDR